MSQAPALRERIANEKGQTTLFVLCSFMVFFMLFALVANVGQAVNRRVMLQMVADAGAFTGASAQATMMNTISEFNQIIDTSWDVATYIMLFWTFQICGVDTAVEIAYKTIEMVMSIMIQVSNRGGAAWALLEAEMVTRRNIRDLFPDESVRTPLEVFDTPSMGYSHAYNLNEAWPTLLSGFQLVALEQESVTKNWICYTPPFSLTSKNATFNMPWEKSQPDEVTRFYWWVTAAPVDALVLPRKPWMPFGFPQVPEMTAVALAKPIGGEIAPDGIGNEYVARLIPLSTIDAQFGDFSGSLPSLTEVLH
jgi:hypothetical protein